MTCGVTAVTFSGLFRSLGTWVKPACHGGALACSEQ
jgi:hypothetical protein